MKLRILFVLVALCAGMVFGLGVHSAHAATDLTATDRANLQAVLNLTKVSLDTIQVQADHNAIQNPAAMLVTLDGIKGILLSIRGILGGPVATAPVAVPSAPVIAQQPSGQVAGSATVAPTQNENPQTASVSSSATAKWAFWGVLLIAVIVAIILAMPKKKQTVAVVHEVGKASVPSPAPMPVATPAPVVEDTQTIQSA